MDYQSLTTQIMNYANRTDAFFTSQIPFFIDQAINRLYTEAKSIGFQTITTGNLAANQPLLAKPQNWRETVSLQINNGTDFSSYLQLRAYEFCTTYAPNAMVTGQPQFYADYVQPQSGVLGSLYLAPIPDQAYPYQLISLAIPIFNATNPTNFLTATQPSLLLYACLLEMTPFLRSDERIPVFESLYNRALQDINRETEERYVDRYAKRNKD